MFTVVDGGLSTALEELGANIDGPLWTARTVTEDPEILEAAHRSFVEAGAEVLITASYQCGVRDTDLAVTTAIARRASRGRALVAASCGPFGASLADGSEYTGDYRARVGEIERYHREKLEVLVGSNPDFIAVETIPLAQEAGMIAEILSELGGPPAWFSFGLADAHTTYGGDRIEDSVSAVRDYPTLVAVGMNCTAMPIVAPALERMKKLLGGAPLVAYPNLARRWDAQAREWKGASDGAPDDETIARWVHLGATYIGGCCGVGPSAISLLADAKRRIVA